MRNTETPSVDPAQVQEIIERLRTYAYSDPFFNGVADLLSSLLAERRKALEQAARVAEADAHKHGGLHEQKRIAAAIRDIIEKEEK